MQDRIDKGTITYDRAKNIAKAGVHSLLAPYSDAVVNMFAKTSAYPINAFRHSTNIYGAAAVKSDSKMLRGSLVTGIATVVVMSTGDVVDIFRGRISFGQLFKNVVNTSANFGGDLLGAFGGGTAAGKVSQAVTDGLIEDDAKEMLRILENEFKAVAVDFLLNKTEGERVADALKQNLDGSKLKDMYASNTARNLRVKSSKAARKSSSNVARRFSCPRRKITFAACAMSLEQAADNEQSYRSPKKYSGPKIVGIGGEVARFTKLVKMLVIFDEAKVLSELREFSVLLHNVGNEVDDNINCVSATKLRLFGVREINFYMQQLPLPRITTMCMTDLR